MKKLYTLFLFLIAVNLSYGQLIINEVLYDPSNSALDGDANGDAIYSQDDDSFIEIYNSGSTAFDMSGYEIWDDTTSGSIQYLFPPNTNIPAGEAVVVFGGGTPTGKFGTAIVLVGDSGLNFNNSGEVIGVKDNNGNWALVFDSDALSNNPNESYTRNPDITGNFEQHADNTSLLFSPGTKVDGTAFGSTVASTDLIINEVLYDPSNNALDGDANGDGIYDQDDDSFIEIYNSSLSPLDISGYEVWDDTTANGTLQHTFAANTVVPANEVIVLFGGGTPTGSFGTALVQLADSNLNLNNSGEVIGIKNSNGDWILFFDSDALSNNPNESYTRFPDVTGSFIQHSDSTTALFSPGTKTDGSAFNPPAAPGQLILNEVLYDPSNNALDGDANRDGVYSQDDDSFIEIYNPDTSAYDISGYEIWDDTTSGSVQYTFPPNTSIPGEEVVLVFGGGTPTGTFGSALVLTAGGGFNFNNSGEIIGVKDTSGAWVLSFNSDALSGNPNESYTRYPDVTGPFIQHSDSTTVLFSPGTKVDGTPFNGSTGLSENDSPINLKVYPNPVKDQLTINSSEKLEQIEIFSINGSKVLSFATQEKQINVAELKSGIYILRVRSKENTANLRFIKE